jgi:peptidoglycan L-alanyl-D-glutamate endopeptidase CwlK
MGLAGAAALLFIAHGASDERPKSGAPVSGQVDPRLIQVLERVSQLGGKYKVIQLMRSVAAQQAAIDAGRSMIRNAATAPHVRGVAVDLSAGTDFKSYVELAKLFAVAARDIGVPVRWGGSWKVLDPNVDPQQQVEEYKAWKKARGEKPFIDRVHFELLV